MGIDATKGLFMLLGKDQKATEVRCALADFDVEQGVLRARNLIFDTGVVRVDGSGTINLSDESVDLTFKGKPKQFRLVRVIAPLTVGGHLASPHFGIQPATAIAQIGAAATLGAVLTPLAAILPFISPGLEKDADCAALLAEARASEAKVSASPASTTPAKGAAKAVSSHG